MNASIGIFLSIEPMKIGVSNAMLTNIFDTPIKTIKANNLTFCPCWFWVLKIQIASPPPRNYYIKIYFSLLQFLLIIALFH